MPENNEEGVLHASWVGLDDLPVVTANQFVSQFDDHGFYLSVGMLAPPLLLGSQEEREAQLKKISFVPINSLARFALSRKTMGELVEVLRANLERYDAVKKESGE